MGTSRSDWTLDDFDRWFFGVMLTEIVHVYRVMVGRIWRYFYIGPQNISWRNAEQL